MVETLTDDVPPGLENSHMDNTSWNVVSTVASPSGRGGVWGGGWKRRLRVVVYGHPNSSFVVLHHGLEPCRDFPGIPGLGVHPGPGPRRWADSQRRSRGTGSFSQSSS